MRRLFIHSYGRLRGRRNQTRILLPGVLRRVRDRKGAEAMKYEAVIVWETGEKEIYPYATEEEARKSVQGYEKAFGKQVAFACVRPCK